MNDAAPLSSLARAPNAHVRARLIGIAGGVIILISVGAALLPLASNIPAANVIGTMMVAAGVIEVLAGALRFRNRFAAMLPGAVTVVAGTLFAHEAFAAFVPTVRLIAAWLAARGAVLAFSSLDARGSVRFWTVIAAGTDLSLSAILLLGLSATTITITFFGPTPEIVASFAWVLALTFVATGMLLLEIAGSDLERA